RELDGQIHRPIFGWGPDTFRFAFAQYRTAAYVATNGYSVTADNAHSYPLQLASGIGVPGMLLLFAFFGSVLLVSTRGGVFSRRSPTSLLRAGFFAAAIGYLVYLMFGLSFSSGSSLLWLALAVMAAGTARTQVVRAPSWGRWARWPILATCGLLIVASAIFVGADHFYWRANSPGSPNRDHLYAQAESLNPFEL
ncbi:MAG: O-antigen ligase family protein, partial [Actinobacteria bacterium]|nr:O-antigen ligase family protein [Actinomycetota bacterium]